MGALYRKYRPQKFDEVIGQEHVVRTLQRAIEQDRLGHAYLFCGPRGVGKTTVARILAKAVNCESAKERPCGACKNCLDIAQGKFIDLIEIDAASNRGIDEIRDLRDKIRFAPNIGKKKVYIIDEVHMLTREAFNALLKTLEEPPAHSLFIFATTEIHKVPQTVISRCQRFDFRLGETGKVLDVISDVAKKEKLKLSSDVAALISRSSGGSYRDAQSLLDQISPHISSREIDLDEAVSILNLSSKKDALDFIETLQAGNLLAVMNFISGVEAKGARLGEFLSDVILSLREVVVDNVKSGEDEAWAKSALMRFIEASGQMRISPIESLPIELAAIDICRDISSAGIKKTAKKDERPKNKPEGKDIKEEKDDTKEAEVVASEPAPKPKKQIKALSAQERYAFVNGVGEKNKPLSSLLSTAQMDYRDGVLKIFVEYPIYAAKIKSKNAILLLEEVLGEILGQKARIECEVCKEDDLSEQIGQVFEVV